MFYMHGAGWGWGWWLLMSVGMVAFWAFVIYGIVWLVRGRPFDQPSEREAERPEEILRRRLAQGDISIEEYERLLSAMHEEPRGRAPSSHGQPTTAVH